MSVGGEENEVRVVDIVDSVVNDGCWMSSDGGRILCSLPRLLAEKFS